MSEMKVNSELEDDNDQNMQDSNKISTNQINQWEKIKILISKDVKEIFWKAWIKPLKFKKYENGILYISTDSKIISNRAETQYYETIFFQASNYFENLKKIKFLILPLSPKNQTTFVNNGSGFKSIQQKNYNDLSFVESVSMKLNSKYTFDNFVVGDANRMPYAASKRISEKNGLIYNPLYIHGNVGMGKTHLLNAIALKLKDNLPNLKIDMMSD